jgi:hypothetical protein
MLQTLIYVICSITLPLSPLPSTLYPLPSTLYPLQELIEYLQELVQKDPSRGFWIISFAAFIASPFLTNDGVCLLFVEPILNAFENAPFASASVASEGVLALTDDASNSSNTPTKAPKLKLHKEDAIYFLLGLACSANIGSALTYTGETRIQAHSHARTHTHTHTHTHVLTHMH